MSEKFAVMANRLGASVSIDNCSRGSTEVASVQGKETLAGGGCVSSLAVNALGRYGLIGLGVNEYAKSDAEA